MISCGNSPAETTGISSEVPSEKFEEDIASTLDQWHAAAGNANFEKYFSLMAEDAVFIGTDPTENWNKPEFKAWARPYFDRGLAWDFSSLERNIFLAETGKTAWFDELLDTQMGICRGSGVLTLINGKWKIQHYVLSIAIPNDQVEAVTDLKKEFDNSLITKLRSTQ